MLKLALPVALLMLVLVGCAAKQPSPSSVFQTWRGQSVDQSKRCWGAPSGATTLSDGGEVLTWTKSETYGLDNSSITVTCAASAEVRDGRVVAVTYDTPSCKDVMAHYPSANSCP